MLSKINNIASLHASAQKHRAVSALQFNTMVRQRLPLSRISSGPTDHVRSLPPVISGGNIRKRCIIITFFLSSVFF
jgi:hypothetical protein